MTEETIHNTHNVQRTPHTALRIPGEAMPYQCRLILEAMLRGERLTVKSAINQYNIGDLRRRIKDLKDFYHVPISSLRVGYKKEWFMTQKDSEEWKVENGEFVYTK